MCGIFEIPHSFEICVICGWQDDDLQNYEKDFEGGANDLSFNQYKSVWLKHKESIIHYEDSKRHFVEKLFKSHSR